MAQSIADLTRTDHRELERNFEALKDPSKRALRAPALVALLAAHARAEEAHVYPALIEHASAADVVEHSQEEHIEADQLAERLLDHDLGDPESDEILDQLVVAVQHHIHEEEDSVLPALEGLADGLQRQLVWDFLTTRSRHLCATIDLTKAELQRQAANEGLSGAASMNKDQLKAHVRTAGGD
jgi:hemerythrin superfamily protein